MAEGYCDVPRSYKTADGYALGAWLIRQRMAYNKGKLSDEQIARLKKLGAID
jgi:hypothetical protein